MTLLKHEVKLFIVQQLAMWNTPQEVAGLVKERFGVEITRQTVAYYNPDTSEDLAKYWRDIFAKVRAEFAESVARIPAASQSYRLKTLQKLIDNQLNNGNRMNPVEVRSLLEQAAKEVGGMFTNKRELTGANGKPLFDVVEMAKIGFKDLINNGIDKSTAVQEIVDRYKVAEEAFLVSEANN